ncbi:MULTISPECIES: S9 family peptidase [Aminobacterium]|jgi:dipeptidyl aminopeptidase/acylaminoacyl peptidase|uniref:S9 family peptidase n=4 Tax=Aminobacteriaceae TaxID=3029087 RepID=UPI00257EDED7|nr:MULTISPECIES: S9 family peptidase [unclassified Aminobacterium]
MSKQVLFIVVVAGLAIVLLFWSTASASALPRIIPLEDFFKNPEKVAFSISPDGQYLAFMQPWQRRLNVFVQKIGGVEEPVRLTDERNRDIAGYFWKGNNQIIYMKDSGGDENYHLFSVDISGANRRELTPFPKVRVSVVDDLEDVDDEMLIAMNKRDPRVFDVYRINVKTGTIDLVAENPGDIAGWLTDHKGKLRVAVKTDGVNTSLLYREKEEDPFRTVVTTNFKDSIDPLFFTFDDQHLYVASNLNRDKSAIYRYDPTTGAFLERVYEHPDVDVYRLLQSKKRKIVTGVRFTTDKAHYVFFDPDREQLQITLEKKLPSYEVVVVSMSRDEKRMLVYAGSDRTLGAYYFYDMESGAFEKLADLSPWLKEEEMAAMRPVRYKARDGLLIHGYLTIPVGVEPKNLPVIILPHGGPWARDSWGFSPEAQFFANRGYAVLSMNFRGSTGYGKQFWTAGFQQWGRAMQDDITDGVKWLIGQGVADPKKVGIYGASYGGYAVLAGLAFTPDVYACGVDYVGPSNLFTLLDTIPPYWELGRQMMYEQIGHPEKDKALLQAASPVFHADQIRSPLLVAQGANDPRVKKTESDQIVEALRKRNIYVEYIVKDNEGHGFRNEENRFEFYRAMERFLAIHLRGRME